jgi:hypothetical protein
VYSSLDFSNSSCATLVQPFHSSVDSVVVISVVVDSVVLSVLFFQVISSVNIVLVDLSSVVQVVLFATLALAFSNNNKFCSLVHS